jgi:hypothetical protein
LSPPSPPVEQGAQSPGDIVVAVASHARSWTPGGQSGKSAGVTSPTADLPLRQLTRLRAEMSIASAQLTAELFPGQPMLGVEFGIVARICVPDWTRGRSLAGPTLPERAITIRKMALSLGGAPESTRRRTNLLLERGALVSTAKGVSLAATPDNEALVMRYYLGVYDRFMRLIEDLAGTCDIDLAVGQMPAFGVADVIERALDTLLLPIDTFRLAGKVSQGFLLWGALTAVAVRNVTYDPVLSRRYANTIPPDDLRIGISLNRLAAAMAIPYATAWRQLQVLHTAGLVTRLDSDCWTVLTRNLLSDSARGFHATPAVLLLNKVRELALLGLDPARAAGHYLLGRPPLADLGLSQNG